MHYTSQLSCLYVLIIFPERVRELFSFPNDFSAMGRAGSINQISRDSLNMLSNYSKIIAINLVDVLYGNWAERNQRLCPGRGWL